MSQLDIWKMEEMKPMRGFTKEEHKELINLYKYLIEKLGDDWIKKENYKSILNQLEISELIDGIEYLIENFQNSKFLQKL